MKHARNGRMDGMGPAGDGSDAELARAARRGDKRAFVEIVARYQAMVCGIALGILGDFSASEDAAQEAFLTAWRKFHELRDPECLRAWLGQIARNAALGYLRRRRGEDSLEHASALPDDSPTPHESAMRDEEAALVRESLANLPETYRLPLVLFYRDGQSTKTVAESLGISEEAVRQRLSRGREILRDRMSGLIETALTRSRPTAVFTMTIAATIGALTAPSAVAGTVFAASTAASTASVSGAAQILTAMSTSKNLLVSAALIAVVCVPVGYYARTESAPAAEREVFSRGKRAEAERTSRETALFANSLLFAEWRQLHDRYGRDGAAMPRIYKAISELKDPVRRRAFRAALIAEWVQVDAPGGLAFILGKGPDANQREQFIREWLSLDPVAAVDALLQAQTGWEKPAFECLKEIAQRLPARLAEVVSRLPKNERYYDRNVRDAFAIFAEANPAAARTAAESVTGANREQALGGIARVWAKSDLEAAMAWAREFPEGTDNDEIIREALIGKATVDPVAALELAGVVPQGGKYAHSESTTGARILNQAAETDFETTVAWVARHPGRFGREDLTGLSHQVTERLNADPVGFLSQYATEGSLSVLFPAIESALLNNAGGQRAVVWDWLKTQRESDLTKLLRQEVLSSAAFQDHELALRLAAGLPRTPEGDLEVKTVAQCLFNGGRQLHQFDKLYPQAPERLRQPLLEAAFKLLREDNMDDPARWISRLDQLPESLRPDGTKSLARAWTRQSPPEAIGWASSLPSGENRQAALAAITSAWAEKDAVNAAEWVASMQSGIERDRSARALAETLGDRHPREAWEWAISIGDGETRKEAALQVAKTIGERDPSTAREWISRSPFGPEVRAELEAALKSRAL